MIDFNKIKTAGQKVLIEYPTKSESGLILINTENNTAQSGWFKIVAVGKGVSNPDITEGREGFVYFHHKPIELEEIVFKTSKEQAAEMKMQEDVGGIVISDALGGLKSAKDFKEPERMFALVGEYDVLFTRERK